PFVSVSRLYLAARGENGRGGAFAATRSFSCSLRGAARTRGVFSLADVRARGSAARHDFAWNRYDAAGPGSRLPHRNRARPRAFRCGDRRFGKSSESNAGDVPFETSD